MVIGIGEVAGFGVAPPSTKTNIGQHLERLGAELFSLGLLGLGVGHCPAFEASNVHASASSPFLTGDLHASDQALLFEALASQAIVSPALANYEQADFRGRNVRLFSSRKGVPSGQSSNLQKYTAVILPRVQDASPEKP